MLRNPLLDLDLVSRHSVNLANQQLSELVHSAPQTLHKHQHSVRRQLRKRLSDLQQQRHQLLELVSANLHLDNLRNLRHRHQLLEPPLRQREQTLSDNLPHRLLVDSVDSDNQLPLVDLGLVRLVVRPLLPARRLLLHRQDSDSAQPPLQREAQLPHNHKLEARSGPDQHSVHPLLEVAQIHSLPKLQRRHLASDQDRERVRLQEGVISALSLEWRCRKDGHGMIHGVVSCRRWLVKAREGNWRMR